MMRALRFVALVVIAVLVGAAVMIAGFAVNAFGVTPAPACAQPVGYMLNAPTLPSWWARVIAIRDAVSMVESASGQRYRFDGYTTWEPTAGNVDDAPDDLVIVVENPEHSPLLQLDPGHAGYTLWTSTHAVIALDALRLQSIPTGIDFAAPGPSIFTLAEHELGHSRGLADTIDSGSVMDPNLTAGPFYSPTDRDQLAATGCRP